MYIILCEIGVLYRCTLFYCRYWCRPTSWRGAHHHHHVFRIFDIQIFYIVLCWLLVACHVFCMFLNCVFLRCMSVVCRMLFCVYSEWLSLLIIHRNTNIQNKSLGNYMMTKQFFFGHVRTFFGKFDTAPGYKTVKLEKRNDIWKNTKLIFRRFFC